MKMINYDELLIEHKSKGYISQDANLLANSLIREYCITNGKGLARFLNVDVSYDNYNAVRVWVQHQLDFHEGYPESCFIDELKLELQSRLSKLVPSMGYE